MEDYDKKVEENIERNKIFIEEFSMITTGLKSMDF